MKRILLLSIVVTLLSAVSVAAEEVKDEGREMSEDSLTINTQHSSSVPQPKKGHWALQLGFNASKLHHHDPDVREICHTYGVNYYDVRFKWRADVNTTNPYDRAMGRPHILVGIMYADYSRLKIYRPETSYHSKIEQIITPYAGVQFDLLHAGRFKFSVDMVNGIGYCPHPFNENKNTDQEIIGSQFSIFVGGAAHIGYRISPNWSLSAGLELRHYSNGTLDRPNLGANTFGGGVTLCYDFDPQPVKYVRGKEQGARGKEQGALSNDQQITPVTKEFYLEASAGVALKALIDRFTLYHSSHNPLYGSFTTMIAPMWRYHRLHASGIGLDYTYADYVYKIHEYDKINEVEQKHYSPHIMGLCARHEVFYKHVSLAVGVGYYLNKKTGNSAKEHESMLYQTVGVRYSPAFAKERLFLGYNVKAHRFSKVDCVQLVLGYRFRLI